MARIEPPRAASRRRCPIAAASLAIVLAAALPPACTVPRSPSGSGAASASAGAELEAALVNERPAVQVPVVAWFDEFNEVLVGRAIIRGYLETRTLDLQSRVRKLRCVGKSDLRIVPPDAVPGVRCDGMRGDSHLTCSDGREIVSEFWTEETCLSGYSKGIDQDGHTFRAVFGGSPARVATIVREALKDLAWKPAPPAVSSRREASERRGLSTGTGFFVSWNGHLVTNYHVIREASRVQVKLDDGDLIEAEVITTEKQDDLALLKVDAIRAPLPLRRESDLSKGQAVFTLGYPLISLQGQEQKATFGRVNALSGPRGDERFVQIDAPIQPGNSGGPLVNEKGEVVGIVSSMLHPLATLSVAGVLPQNVNYAIKSDLAHEMVRYWLGSAWQRADPAGIERRASELIPEIEDAVVLVVAE
jgi:S1-C subfamily serine protease